MVWTASVALIAVFCPVFAFFLGGFVGVAASSVNSLPETCGPSSCPLSTTSDVFFEPRFAFLPA